MSATISNNQTIIFGLDQDVYRWLDSMSAQPSSTFVYNLNTMVSKLKAAAVWDQLDRFWLFATEDRQHAQVCIKSLSAVTEVSSPTWTLNQGYNGNGTSSYLRTGFIPSTHGVNHTLNSNSAGVYSRTNVQGDAIEFGTYDGTVNRFYYNRFWSNAGSWSNAIYSAADATNPNTNSSGLFNCVRLTSSTGIFYRNGISVGTNIGANGGLSTREHYACAFNQNGVATNLSTRQLSMIYFGSGAIDNTKFYQIFQEFATRQGFNV